MASGDSALIVGVSVVQDVNSTTSRVNASKFALTYSPHIGIGVDASLPDAVGRTMVVLESNSATGGTAAISNTPPVVTKQPANVSTIAGGTATFSAGATGSPSPTVQWQESPDNGRTWNGLSVATSPTYSFTSTEAQNGDQFRAVFKNAAGTSCTNVATLTVNTIPQLTSQPSNTSVTAGTIASFTAMASGRPTPAVQWQVSTNGGMAWQNIANATSTTYSFAVVPQNNQHQYRAVFSNAAGSATSAVATLTVTSLPGMSFSRVKSTVTSTGSAIFNSTAMTSTVRTFWRIVDQNA